jgi:hypothetical protein
MGIEALLETLKRREGADPSATCNPVQPHVPRPGLQKKAIQIKPVSPETLATPQNGNDGAQVTRRAWRVLIRMPDGDPREPRWAVWLFPAPTSEADALEAARKDFADRVLDIRP